MSFESNIVPVTYDGDDSTTEFTYPYLTYEETDVQVILIVDSTGVETVQTLTTHYTVSGLGVDTGSTITMVTAPATGETLMLVPAVDYTQPLTLIENDPFPSQSVMQQLDRAAMMARQNRTMIDKSVRLSDGDMSGASPILPAPAANKSFAWDATGLVLEEVDSPASSASDAAASAAAALVSENNASTSETNAAASEVAAEAAALSASANVKSIGWTFDDTTTMADPGSGAVRLNNATIASVTAISVDALDINGLDVSDYVAAWGASSNTVKGTIILRKVGDDTFIAVFNITAAVTDSTGWLQITVAHVASSGTLTDGDSLYLHVTRAGDAGASGAGSGDMVAANNLSDVASVATSRTNLGLGDLATVNSVSSSQINNDAVTPDELEDTAVTPGEYSLPTLTVDQQGRITDISNGSQNAAYYTHESSSAPSISGTNTTVPFNTEVLDPGGIGSLSSNQITLPAGTYRVDVHTSYAGSASQNRQWRLRLQNITDGTTLLSGGTSSSAAGGGGGSGNSLSGIIVIDDTKVLEIQCSVSVGAIAGFAVGAGSQVFNTMSIVKIG